MSSRANCLFFCVLCGIAALDANSSSTTAATIERAESLDLLTTYLSDYELLRDVATKVELLRAANENTLLKLETQNLRLQQQLMQQKNELLNELRTLREASEISSSKLAKALESTDSLLKAAHNASNSKEVAVCAQVCNSLPTSCAEALQRASNNGTSGIYQLYLPASGLKPFYVYCLQDSEGGAAWTLIQRRQDNSTDFYRGWQDYKTGFGNLNGEFFIGLDKLHALTHSEVQELGIQMEDFANQKRYAKYDSFAIGDEQEKYALNVLGNYAGDAGDALRPQQGQKFTTKDNDNDTWPSNCAVKFIGAWWYSACHNSNLNGLYLAGAYSKDKYAQGVVWATWHHQYYSLKRVHMGLRPRK